MSIKIRNIIFFTALAFLPSVSHATFTFTDVSYTSNSVNFTINGDMSGYDNPNSKKIFSILYAPGMLLAGQANNAWSSNVFDDEELQDDGDTNTFSWSEYSKNLKSAVATGNDVTLALLSQNLLDTGSGFSADDISFVWGNSQDNKWTVLGVGIAPTVPIPASVWFMGSGLLGLFGFARKNKTQVAGELT